MINFRALATVLLLSPLAIAVAQDAQPDPEAQPAPEAPTAAAVSAALPEAVTRPQRGETPRYPEDVVIGELGRGTAPEAAYDYARQLTVALAQRNDAFFANAERAAEYYAVLEPVGPFTARIGGGRTEPDDSVSFLVRFLGKEQAVSGEIYLRLVHSDGAADGAPGDAWRLDDLFLEEARPLEQEREFYRYDFSPYERFY